MLGYVLPILTEAWPGKGRGGGEAQNDRQCQGLLPPIFWGLGLRRGASASKTKNSPGAFAPIFGGVQILHPLFLNFGPRGNCRRVGYG